MNCWSAGMVSPFLGKVNLGDGILVVKGMAPMGAGLHQPLATSFLFVISMGRLGTVVMKLLVDVSEAT
jgi:hypothetical protein